MCTRWRQRDTAGASPKRGSAETARGRKIQVYLVDLEDLGKNHVKLMNR